MYLLYVQIFRYIYIYLIYVRVTVMYVYEYTLQKSREEDMADVLVWSCLLVNPRDPACDLTHQRRGSVHQQQKAKTRTLRVSSNRWIDPVSRKFTFHVWSLFESPICHYKDTFPQIKVAMGIPKLVRKRSCFNGCIF